MLLQTAVLNPLFKKKGPHQRLELDEQTSLNDFFVKSVLINHSSVLPLHGPFLCHSSMDHFSVTVIVVVNSL